MCPAFGLLVQSHSPLCSFTLQGQIRGTSATLALIFIVGWGLSQEHYCGEWDSEEDFARHIIEECYNLELEIAEYLLHKLNMKQKMMGSLANYFDYEAFLLCKRQVDNGRASCGTTTWERTVTYSAESDPQTTPKNGLLARSSLAELKVPKGKALF
ncbi:MAG: antirestriction protein ArdA [Bacteroidales bacterium]|nr:antirestriction protein ArdA [Bacteroidales bacterium]